MEDKDHKYLCWLAGIRGIGRKKKFSLLQAAGEANLFSMEAGTTLQEKDPGIAARILYTAPEKELRFLWGEAFAKTAGGHGSHGEWQALFNARRQEPERIEEKLVRAGISFVSALDKEFPEKLKEIPDPPFGIYYKGSMPGETEPAAAIIGARLASGYGREQARRFGRQIGSNGISVISGMARGIDGIAQKAALDAGGKSFAVLGCGVDICYPEENRKLYERLQQEGGVLSEYPPGVQPVAKIFPPRNRIISGLSDLVLVIEARKRSGTLITVDMALEQGRDVYALPGRVSDALSDGCNRLIRQGAWPATCPQDILEYFFGPADSEDSPVEETSCSQTSSDAAAAKSKMTRPPLEKAILGILSGEDDMHLERIHEALGRFSEYDDEREEPPEGMVTESSADESKRMEKSSEVPLFVEAIPGTEKSFQVSVNELITALMHLKVDGKVKETTAGYFRRVR